MDGPIKYFGGKSFMAHHLHELAPPHLHRVHTHAGGLGEFWNWTHENVSEVVNDINGVVINFWRTLQHNETFEQFKRTIEAVPLSEEEFKQSQILGDMPIDDYNPNLWSAVHFFIQVRQSMSGRMDSFTPLSKNRLRRGMNEQVSSWLTAIEGLPEVHTRLKRVAVVKGRDVTVILKEDSANTLFYCDPPYLHSTRTSADVYANEMHKSHHEALLYTLSRIQGKFMLSGYDNDLYNSFGWNRKEYDLPNHSASGEIKRRMKEIVWYNF